MKRRILGLSLVAAAALAGCGPFGSPGSLQTGDFGYVCSNSASTIDVACGGGISFPSDVPSPIAIGAHFDIQYSPVLFSSNPVVSSLAPAAPSMLTTEDSLEAGATGFRFTSPGTVAILGRASDGTVVDFVHVSGAALDHVSVQDSLGEEVTSITLPSTSGSSLRAFPQGSENQHLAGGLAYTWTTSDSTVVTVGAAQGFGAASNEVTLVPVGPGKATVTVQILDKQVSIDVTNNGGTP